jgi:DNA-binding CsgD family transcriptional regulator/dipeptidyl aminopeptidase/acylaminoacyl peptidase
VNRGRPRHDDILTPREWDVLELIREGLTNEEIAERLGVAHNTVKYHVSEILSKLGVESRQEAARWRGRPKVAFGLAPVAGLLGKLGSVSKLKLAGAGALGTAGVALVLLALGVLMGNGDGSLGKIAFVREGNIWVQELPDGAPYQLTNVGNASRPYWSPSGAWLLYTRRDADADRPPGLQLWVIREDGSNERMLSDNGYSGYWLRDEDERVQYLTSDAAVVEQDAAGGNQETVFAPFEEDGERVTRFPFLWPSPDGKYQLYLETREPVEPPVRGMTSPVTTVWVRSSNSDPVQISTIDPQADTQLLPYGWSADRSHVLLVSVSDARDCVRPAMPLLAVPAQGGEPTPVGLNVSLTTSPANRDDGEQIVVAGIAQESWTDKRLALIARDASGYTMLTSRDVAAIGPAWSPDGKQIAYVAAPDTGTDAREEALSQRRVWLMAADGSNQRQLTDGPGFRDELPMWSSDGKSILFARLIADDPCYGGSYDLMRYQLDDGSLETLVSDLRLFGTWYDMEVGEIPECELSVDGITTDTFGDLYLSFVLHWWQPGPR